MCASSTFTDFGMLLRDGPHQRRLAARAMSRSDSRLGGQHFDHGGKASARRHHTGVSPASSARLGFAPASRSRLTIARAAILAGGPQGRRTQIIGRVHFGAGLEQQIRAIQIVSVAAQCSAVAPSPSVTLTSAFFWISARIASLSLRFAASTNEGGPQRHQGRRILLAKSEAGACLTSDAVCRSEVCRCSAPFIHRVVHLVHNVSSRFACEGLPVNFSAGRP